MSIVRRPSSLATSYAQNYIPHPGFDWVEAVGTFLPQQNAEDMMREIMVAWAATKEDKAVLIQELRNFQTRMAEKTKGRCKPGKNIDLDKCSANDVLQALQSATAREGSGKRPSIYRAICKIGKHSDVLKQWLSLLPQGDYGSGICGAFTILLDVSARIYAVDNYVYECLASIPAALQKATTYMEIYREQQPLNLIEKSIGLYKSVLLAVTECVKYTQKNTSVLAQTKRVISAFVNGDNYKQSLKDAINDVAEKVNVVEEEAKLCQHKRIGGIHEMLMHERGRFERTNSVGSLGLKERQMIGILNCMKDHLDSHGCLDKKGHLRESIEEAPSEPPRKQRRKIKAAKPAAQTAEPAIEEILIQDLLSIIAYNSFTLAQDLVEALNVRVEPDSKGMHQLYQAVKSDELCTFLRTPTVSSVLAINANSEEPSNLSPLSFLDCQVAQLLSLSDDSILLMYFCSLHAESWDLRASATGLIASLVGQLLSYPKLGFDISFIDSEMEQLLDQDDFLTLVQLFLSLLHQLPVDANIFCIIDEVSVYETPERQEDMRKLLATLVRQVIGKHTDRDFPVFKLLLTDGSCSGFDTILGMENVLDLSEDGEGENMDVIDMVGSVFE